jgi:transcriptional regulator with XRE-family HTH domain
MEEVTQRIQELRKTLGISQEDFAKKVDLDRTLISKIEKNTIIPKTRHISLICRAFRVNETWLCSGIGEMFVDTPEGHLTNDEEKLIVLFRQLLPDLQKFVLEKVDELLKKMQEPWVPPSSGIPVKSDSSVDSSNDLTE